MSEMDQLDRYSLEITPRHRTKLDQFARVLKPGSRVYIALVDAADNEAQVATARDLRDRGFEPVPHLPARFVAGPRELENRLAAFRHQADVTQFLVLAGGAQKASGPFRSSMDILQTGLLQKYGIVRLGFAGHPEGNPDITRAQGEEALMGALSDKQTYAREHGFDAYIVTQFLFEARPLIAWMRRLRQNGIELPVHAGLPGPATIKTLAKYAMLCGVGNSARFIRKQALNVTKLLKVSAPDALVDELAALSCAEPELGLEQFHYYPFGGFEKLFDWLESRSASRNEGHLHPGHRRDDDGCGHFRFA